VVTQENTIFLSEIDACALRDALRNNPRHPETTKEFVGEAACNACVKKLTQPLLITLPKSDFKSIFFFSSLAIAEIRRLVSDPATKCRHTAKEHLQSLLFIVDSLDCIPN